MKGVEERKGEGEIRGGWKTGKGRRMGWEGEERGEGKRSPLSKCLRMGLTLQSSMGKIQKTDERLERF